MTYYDRWCEDERSLSDERLTNRELHERWLKRPYLVCWYGLPPVSKIGTPHPQDRTPPVVLMADIDGEITYRGELLDTDGGHIDFTGRMDLVPTGCDSLYAMLFDRGLCYHVESIHELGADLVEDIYLRVKMDEEKTSDIHTRPAGKWA